MSNPSTNTDSLLGSYDYQTLLDEIKISINRNDNLFKLIQKANYPDAGNYTSDLLDYKIDTQINALKEPRVQIWDFLTKKYAENTELRTYYFTELRKVDNYTNDLVLQKQEYIDIIEATNMKTNTSIKSIKNEKYNFNKIEYYVFLYKILVFVQLAILATITLCITGIIPRSTCLIITVIMLLSTVAFVAYYVFFVNIGRNKFSWNKFEHKSDVPVKAGQCTPNNLPGDKAKQEADDKIKAIIAETKQNEKCSS